MAKGHKTGGRVAGTPNRKTQEISALLESLGCDPIEGMAQIAMDEKHSPELRGRMYAELAQYGAPKRKAVAHSGAAEQPLTIRVLRCDEDVQKLFNEAADCLRAIGSKSADLDTNERLTVILEERKTRHPSHQEFAPRLAASELSKLSSV